MSKHKEDLNGVLLRMDEDMTAAKEKVVEINKLIDMLQQIDLKEDIKNKFK